MNPNERLQQLSLNLPACPEEPPTLTFTPVPEPIFFQGWPKIARLNRGIAITEKLDGTNGAIGITADGRVYAQGRNRILTPQDDNFGFARWVERNADHFRKYLGEGLHFGEWWGCGINRDYDLTERRFSLFNITRWSKNEAGAQAIANLRSLGIAIYTVPVLYEGPWTGVLGYVNGPLTEVASAVGEGPVWLDGEQKWPEFDLEIQTRETKIQSVLNQIIEIRDDSDEKFTQRLHDLAAPINPRPRYAPSFIMEWLKRNGSFAVPGYMKPEGIVIYHKASDICFKATCEKDEEYKGKNGVSPA